MNCIWGRGGMGWWKINRLDWLKRSALEDAGGLSQIKAYFAFSGKA